MKRRNAGQNAYVWWAKMSLDEIKATRAVLEAAKMFAPLLDDLQKLFDDVDEEGLHVDFLEAVRALAESEEG